MNTLWDSIIFYSKTAGRNATREMLKAYYVMTDTDIPAADKIVLLAAITYIVVPTDLIPAKRFGVMGLLDDATITAYISRKLRRCMTSDINDKVEKTLTQWFGPEYVYTTILNQ